VTIWYNAVMDIPVIVDKDGKKVFIGQEDPNNPPVVIHSPNKRFCSHCQKESENDQVYCTHCKRQFDDGKMECPTCHRYFDYLVGSDENGGRMGCEVDWLPPKKHE
jgi:hypothetical protein